MTDKERVAMLLEVIGIVRCHPDFDQGGPMAEMMDQALNGVDHPQLVVAVAHLAQGRKPPERIQPEAGAILKAQEHAIECGQLALELQSALAMLTNACADAGWPKTAEQMAPMNMARAALNKRYPPQKDSE